SDDQAVGVALRRDQHLPDELEQVDVFSAGVSPGRRRRAARPAEVVGEELRQPLPAFRRVGIAGIRKPRVLRWLRLEPVRRQLRLIRIEEESTAAPVLVAAAVLAALDALVLAGLTAAAPAAAEEAEEPSETVVLVPGVECLAED